MDQAFEQPRRIRVSPASELRARPRLFAALATAFPVQFVESPAGEVDATVVIGAESEEGPTDGRTYIVEQPPLTTVRTGRVTFSGASGLDARLRGRTLTDAAVPDAGLVVGEQVDVLAASGDRPVWTKQRTARGECDRVISAPAELGEGEVLRDRVTPLEFLGVLPLVHFLRELTAGSAWTPPAPRATFVIDDPNLHWPSYGYLDFAEVVESARRTQFHLAIATVPFDAWFAHRSAVRTLREATPYLSLAMHGNNHTTHELRSLRTPANAVAAMAEGLRRVRRFEQGRGSPSPASWCRPTSRAQSWRWRPWSVSAWRAFR